MLEPAVPALIAGVAESLASTVLGDIPPGPARQQVQAAIGILRRVAAALPMLGPHLQAEAALLAEGLAAVWTALGASPKPEAVAAQQACRALAAGHVAGPGTGAGHAPTPHAGALPSLDELYAVVRAGHAALAETVEALHAVAAVQPVASMAGEAPVAVTELLQALLAHDQALGLSPW